MLSLTLPPDLREFVDSQINDGTFGSENEVLVNALYLLRERTLSRDQRLAQLRTAVKIGLEELDRGEGQPWDKEEVWSEVQRRLDERKAKS
jgi:putative addiction module CopG family antidote